MAITERAGGRDCAVAIDRLISSTQPDPIDIALIADCLATSPEERQSIIGDLSTAREAVKVTIVQQFFSHPQAGTHRTSFNEEIVADLLAGWFAISLDPEASRPTGRFSGASREANLPVQTFAFGSTQFFAYMTPQKRGVLESLTQLLGDDAVLTTDRTSPPSTLAELTPLWMKEPERSADDHYLSDSPAIDFESFFESYETATESALGVRFREHSREIGFVFNGDGLRYHRDRVVNQYAKLKRETSETVERTRLVQDLSLADWDMQDGTFSGTAFVHPLGDRYLFLLEPGSAISLYFAEHVDMPGPLMMPFHLALPVADSYAGSSVGEAKGKRFSCLMRGLADAVEVDRLVDAAEQVDVHERMSVDGGFRFPSGMRIESGTPPSYSLVNAESGCYNANEGCLVTRLSSDANAPILDHLGIGAVAGMFRVVKNGDGFSAVHDLVPEIGEFDLVILNRSVDTPQAGTSYPLTLHLPGFVSPVLQMIEFRHEQVLTVPGALLKALYLSPTAPVFHRSELLDAFYPTAVRTPKMTTVLDLAIVAGT